MPIVRIAFGCASCLFLIITPAGLASTRDLSGRTPQLAGDCLPAYADCEYSLNGTLVSYKENGTRFVLSHDALNRTIRIETIDPVSGTTAEHHFRYLGDSMVVHHKIDDSGSTTDRYIGSNGDVSLVDSDTEDVSEFVDSGVAGLFRVLEMSSGFQIDQLTVDPFHNVVAEVNSAGERVRSIRYSPFGEALYDMLEDPVMDGAPIDVASIHDSLLFLKRPYIRDLELYRTGARFYDAQRELFVKYDEKRAMDNLYAYFRNPFSGIDPSGYSPQNAQEQQEPGFLSNMAGFMTLHAAHMAAWTDLNIEGLKRALGGSTTKSSPQSLGLFAGAMSSHMISFAQLIGGAYGRSDFDGMIFTRDLIEALGGSGKLQLFKHADSGLADIKMMMSYRGLEWSHDPVARGSASVIQHMQQLARGLEFVEHLYASGRMDGTAPDSGWNVQTAAGAWALWAGGFQMGALDALGPLFNSAGPSRVMVRSMALDHLVQASNAGLLLTLQGLNRTQLRALSTAIAAIDVRTGKILYASSGSAPNIIADELLTLANQYGGIGAKLKGMEAGIGCCAEFRAVNRLLLSGSSLKDIVLTPALLPRNPSVLKKTCVHCVLMFGDKVIE